MIGLPILWAQATGTNANSLASLALRRWYSSLTLSSSDPVPSLDGLWAWLFGLGTLFLLALFFQGPSLALRQGFDLPGHLRLIASALSRLRRSGRVVALALGTTVLAWTGSQCWMFQQGQGQGRDDLILLIKSRGLGELAFEQALYAALTPLRDLAGLADNLPLLILATVLLFRVTAEQWSGPYVPLALRRQVRPPIRGEVVWAGGALYFLYKLVLQSSGAGDLPVGGCMMVEVVVIPALMLLLDATLFCWILVELRNAGLGDTGNDTLKANEVIMLLPGAMLACLLVLPARYLSTAVLLAWFDMPTVATHSIVGHYVRWQLGSGLADVQGAALVFMGAAGVVAWTRGTVSGVIRAYPRLLAAEGGRLAAILGLAGLSAGFGSAVAYLVVLSLPAQSWVLSAADGYAHYATLPIGLITLAALVELGERALPTATLAGTPLDDSGSLPAIS